MKKTQYTAGALRAFAWLAANTFPEQDQRIEIRIHRGGGACRCTKCEEAPKHIDRIVRASK